MKGGVEATDKLTVVMYHYVRPIAGSRYEGVRGLEAADFDQQLDYLSRHHTFVSAPQVAEAYAGGAPLPERPALLTFDDGFVDHHEHVMPRLAARGIGGAFYPPSCAVLERRLLDVHKLQFVLAVGDDAAALAREVEALAHDGGVDDFAGYRARYRKPSRFDPAEVVYVKAMLQHALPARLRATIVDHLFRRFVSADPRDFADSLYVSVAQLQGMVDAGMHVGSHGHDHPWLATLPADDQRADVVRSMEMLEAIGQRTAWFSFCYPFGSYDETTVAILAELGCRLAFTTEVALADVQGAGDFLEVPRLDTNDVPKLAAAPPNHWTQGVGGAG